MFKRLFNFNKWQKVQKTNAKGKTYTTHACSKCGKETLVTTTYCAHCGKRMIKGGK